MSADCACSSFSPRSERDVTNCACGWSAAAHLPPEERPRRLPGYYLLDVEHDPGLLRYGPPLCAK